MPGTHLKLRHVCCLSALLIIGATAYVSWAMDYGQVEFEIDEKSTLIAKQSGITQHVAVDIINSTSKKARLVGSNVC